MLKVIAHLCSIYQVSSNDIIKAYSTEEVLSIILSYANKELASLIANSYEAV